MDRSTCCGIASLAWNPGKVSAGASGAVFGTAGELLGFVVLRRDTISDDARKRMLKSMVNFLILNMLVGMLVPQIDMPAQTGGFLGGVFCGLLLSQPLAPGILALRKFRNLIAVMAAGIILPIAVVALLQAPPDICAEMQRLSLVENQIYDEFNAYQEAAATGQSTTLNSQIGLSQRSSLPGSNRGKISKPFPHWNKPTRTIWKD